MGVPASGKIAAVSDWSVRGDESRSDVEINSTPGSFARIPAMRVLCVLMVLTVILAYVIGLAALAAAIPIHFAGSLIGVGEKTEHQRLGVEFASFELTSQKLGLALSVGVLLTGIAGVL